METTQMSHTQAMTVDEALERADEWIKGVTLHAGVQGWRVACHTLATEVRRLRRLADQATHNCDNCNNCRHWKTDENRYNCAIDPEFNPVTFDEWASEEEKRKFFPYTVRYCKHPKVVFYQRPDSNGVAVFDGSEYMAYLATGQDYGCVNFEPANATAKGPARSDGPA